MMVSFRFLLLGGVDHIHMSAWFAPIGFYPKNFATKTKDIRAQCQQQNVKSFASKVAVVDSYRNPRQSLRYYHGLFGSIACLQQDRDSLQAGSAVGKQIAIKGKKELKVDTKESKGREMRRRKIRGKGSQLSLWFLAMAHSLTLSLFRIIPQSHNSFLVSSSPSIWIAVTPGSVLSLQNKARGVHRMSRMGKDIWPYRLQRHHNSSFDETGRVGPIS